VREKTTLCRNLGMYLFSKGKRVLIIDLDPQSNATLLGLKEEDFKSHIKTKKPLHICS